VIDGRRPFYELKNELKVPKCEIFDHFDFHYFYTIKSLRAQSSLCICSPNFKDKFLRVLPKNIFFYVAFGSMSYCQ
jgi:hypothetical protein